MEWEPDWEGREIIKKADLKIYDINPTAAYRNGPFRIGGGIQIVRATVELTKDINLLDNGYVGVDLGAGAWGVGGNVGIQYEAVPKVLTLAATYRSSVNLNFSGNAHFENVPPSTPGRSRTRPATTKLKLPDTFGFGIAVRPIPELVIDLDLNYFAWQQFQAIDIKFEDPQLNTYEAKQWGHSWNYRIGAEYTLSEHIQLRTGILSTTRTRARPTPCCRTSPTPTASTSALAAPTASAPSGSSWRTSSSRSSARPAPTRTPSTSTTTARRRTSSRSTFGFKNLARACLKGSRERTSGSPSLSGQPLSPLRGAAAVRPDGAEHVHPLPARARAVPAAAGAAVPVLPAEASRPGPRPKTIPAAEVLQTTSLPDAIRPLRLELDAGDVAPEADGRGGDAPRSRRSSRGRAPREPGTRSKQRLEHAERFVVGVAAPPGGLAVFS